MRTVKHWIISHCMCVCVYHNFCLHSSINGHLSCLGCSITWLLGMNDTLLLQWTWELRSLWDNDFTFLGYICRRGIDESHGSSIFKYWRTLISFLEKAMAPHSSTLAWEIPWMEEPGGLQSMGSLGVRHDWATSFSLFTFMHWRRKWQPTPVFLPGESQGWWSLVGCRLWGHTELDTTEVT